MTEALTFRCSCGARADASSVPQRFAGEIIGTIRQAHLGQGHHEVDQSEYRRIRDRQRREERKEAQAR